METPTPEASETLPSSPDASIQPSADIPVAPIDQQIIEPEEKPAEEVVGENLDDAEESTETITLDDLATYTGLETDRFELDDQGDVLYRAKVDKGVEVVPLKVVFDNYQKSSHLKNENKEVVALKKSLQAQQASDRENVNAKIQAAEDMLALSYQDLQGEDASEEWDQLYEDDPALFAAKKAKQSEKSGLLQSRYAQLVQAREDNQPDLSKSRAEMADKLMEVIPGWDNKETASKEFSEINDYAISKGFQQNHLNTLVDHRLMELLHKSMKYDELLSEKVSITKAVRKSPKFAKSGAVTGKKDLPKTYEQIFYGT